MSSRRKPMNDRAGYVASRRNSITGGWNVIYRASEAALDPAGGPWVVSCETHGVVCNHKNLPGARASMKWPGFCEACMERAAFVAVQEAKRTVQNTTWEKLAQLMEGDEEPGG